jgi:signal transduction histidine kinase/CheY-like chemotaxis protein
MTDLVKNSDFSDPKTHSRSGSGLRQRIILPLLTMGVVLGLIFTLSHGFFFRGLLQNNLRIDSDLIVNAVEFTSSRGESKQSLIGFLTSLSRGSDVKSILVYDATRSSIYAESRNTVTSTQSFLNNRKELLENLKTEGAKETKKDLYLPRQEGHFWIFRFTNLQNADTKAYFEAIIHINIDSAEFLGFINQSQLVITMAWIIFIAVILIFTTIFLWRTILYPSQNIVDIISKVEEGSRYQTVPEHYAGEIGTIAQALNSFFRTMNRQEKELKEKNQNLIAATKDAQEKGEAKTRFLANMSHEIRTPLNAVLGFSHLLTNTKLNSKQTDLVDSIKSSGETLLALINDILDFSKVESERIEFEERRFDLLEIIDSTLDVIASRVIDANIGFGYTLDKNLPNVFIGDSDRLRQVLLNLLTNAIKFTERGFIQLTVGGQALNSEKFTLEVEIKDTGIGIAKENLDKLFSPFTQEDASTTRKYGGTGLGLSISKKIVESNGGDILVESSPGFGSIFTFTYIFSRVEDDHTLVDSQYFSGKKIALMSRKTTTIETVKSFMDYLSIHVEVYYSSKDYILQNELEGLDCDWVIYDFESKDEDHLEEVLSLQQHCSQDERPFFLSIPLSWLEEFNLPTDGTIHAYLSPPLRFYPLYNALQKPRAGKDNSNVESTENIETDENREITMKHTSTSKRILLVEDNTVNQKVSTLLLEELGYNVVLAKNGQEAITLLQQDSDFLLVFMDIQMPIMDGNTATEILRSMGPPYDEIPIIALSANAFKEEKDSAMSSGMNDFLPSPNFSQT